MTDNEYKFNLIYSGLTLGKEEEEAEEKVKKICYSKKDLLSIIMLLREVIDRVNYLSFMIGRIQIFQDNVSERREENKNHKDFKKLQKRYLKLKNSHDLFLNELKSFLKEMEEN